MMMKTQVKRFTPLFLMMAPGLLYLLVNNYLPLFGLVIPFKEIRYNQGILAGIINGDWVGLENFKFLFNSSNAFIITRNTILYNLAFIIINNSAALALALLLKEVRSKGLGSFLQSSLLFPNFISMIIVSYLAMAFLNTESGFLNRAILPLLGKESLPWYQTSGAWPCILITVNLWKNAGMLAIVYLAAMLGIDTQYYEAAVMEGAGKLRQALSITLPIVSPVVIMMALLSIGRIFYSDFGLFYQVPQDSGVLYDVTNTIDTYVFRALIKLGDIGMASAAGVYQSLVGFLLVLGSNYLVKRMNRESALF
jgi:putative aldouronate transport system permease protein